MIYKLSKVRIYLFSFTILFGTQNITFAISNICPGEPQTIYWSTTGVTTCNSTPAAPGDCYIGPITPNASESTTTKASNSCSIQIICDGSLNVTDDININPNQARCCGNWDLVGTTWNGSTCASQPDLTVAAATPSSAVPGTTNFLSALITNSGTNSTGASFNNFFQVANASNGGGTITDLSSVSTSTLAAGASTVVSTTHTFPNGPGTYSIRLCADKANAGDSGTITESDESNNCGSPWTDVTVACPAGAWDTINSTCADPQVVSSAITDQHYPPGDIRLECSGALEYSVEKNGVPFIPVTAYPVPGPVVINDVVTATDNYTMKCIHGSVVDTAVELYDATLNPPGVDLGTSVTVVDPPSETTITWDVDNPTNSCTLTAAVVCANNACSPAQTAETAALNAILSGSNTDANDPNTSRPMLTAIRTPAPGHKDSDIPVIVADYKALGKKTIPIKYTTDITFDCNGTKETKRIRVTKSEEQ